MFPVRYHITYIYLVLIALSEEDALGIPGVVSSILLFSGLGSLPWKHFAIETSKNAESCSETVATCAVICKNMTMCLHSIID